MYIYIYIFHDLDDTTGNIPLISIYNYIYISRYGIIMIPINKHGINIIYIYMFISFYFHDTMILYVHIYINTSIWTMILYYHIDGDILWNMVIYSNGIYNIWIYMVQWYLLKVAKTASGGMSCHGKFRCEISHNCTHGSIFLEIFKKIWQLVSILPTPKSFGTSSVVLVHRYDSCGYSWHFMAL